MNKIACQYAIVQFAPFVETGEFANVGIIMIAPKLRFFGFELELKRFKRVTEFFDDVDGKFYRHTLNNLKDELERVAEVLKVHGFDDRLKKNDIDFADGLFKEVVRTRETIVRFGDIRTVLTDDPDKKIKELFAFYVGRNFVTKEHWEALLERDVRKLLNVAEVGKWFKNEKLGDENYHVTFPFVRHDPAKRGDQVKVIKPLHLGHDEPTKMYERGATWVYRVNRLKGKFLNPDDVLFALAGPANDKVLLEAYREVERDLKATGAQVTGCGNEEEITRFAVN